MSMSKDLGFNSGYFDQQAEEDQEPRPPLTDDECEEE